MVKLDLLIYLFRNLLPLWLSTALILVLVFSLYGKTCFPLFRKKTTWGQTAIFATAEKNKQSNKCVTTGIFHGRIFLHFHMDEQGHIQLPSQCFRDFRAVFLPWNTFLIKTMDFPPDFAHGHETNKLILSCQGKKVGEYCNDCCKFSNNNSNSYNSNYMNSY